MRTKFKVAIAAALLAMPVATIVHPVDAATKVTVVKLKKSDFQPYRDPADMRKMTGTYWKKSSETKKAYPNLRKVKNLNLRVSILAIVLMSEAVRKFFIPCIVLLVEL